jgi:hypothetical protein
MKKILEFNCPEDNDLFEDYEEGVKAINALHYWLQITKKSLEYNEMTGQEVYDSLLDALEDVRIFR